MTKTMTAAEHNAKIDEMVAEIAVQMQDGFDRIMGMKDMLPTDVFGMLLDQNARQQERINDLLALKTAE